MRYFYFLSESAASASYAPQELAQKFGGKNKKRKRHCPQKLGGLQRHGAQHRPAEVDKAYLNGENGGHYRDEGGVFSYSRKQAQAVGARVEAVEHPGKDEKGKKCGKEVYPVRRGAEVMRKKRQLEKAERQRDGEHAEKNYMH